MIDGICADYFSSLYVFALFCSQRNVTTTTQHMALPAMTAITAGHGTISGSSNSGNAAALAPLQGLFVTPYLD